MTTQMIIRIDDETKSRLKKLAMLEGKTTSEMVRELIEERLKERDIVTYIDSLWNKIGSKLEAKGVTQADIDKAIEDSRQHQ